MWLNWWLWVLLRFLGSISSSFLVSWSHSKAVGPQLKGITYFHFILSMSNIITECMEIVAMSFIYFL